MLALLAATTFAAPCPEALSYTSLEARLDEAEHALGDLRSDRFLELTRGLASDVECIDDVLTPPQAAHLHRVFALRAFLGRQEDDTRSAFSASRAADPTYVLPFWLVPEQHTLRGLYAEAVPDPALRPVIPARNAEIRMDGAPTTDRPLLRPVFVQIVDDEGSVATSAWLRPSDAMPAYTPTRPILPPLIGNARTLRRTLLVVAGATAVGAVASYGVAGIQNARFQKATDRETLLGGRRGANSMVGTSIVCAGVSVGSFTGALLVGRL